MLERVACMFDHVFSTFFAWMFWLDVLISIKHAFSATFYGKRQSELRSQSPIREP